MTKLAKLFAFAALLINGVHGQGEPAGTHLMVVGKDNGGSGDVEIVDLSETPQPCRKPERYPAAYHDHMGTYINGAPLVCGELGHAWCYTYDQERDGWDRAPYEPIHDGGGWLISTSNVMLDDETWLVSGGYNQFSVQDIISEMRPAESSVQEFEVRLPSPNEFHNFLKINDTHLFVVNGFEQGAVGNTYLYEIGSLEWQRMPRLAHYLYKAFAGVVTLPDGQKEVVVTGGENDVWPQTETWIFNLDTLTWRQGLNDFPEGDFGVAGESVPFGDTFLAVGGFGRRGEDHDQIYRYNHEDESFTEMPSRLQLGRSRFAAFLVPAEMC